MTVVEIILTVISGVLGCSSLVTFILYRTESKRTKCAEADLAAAEANTKEWELEERRISQLSSAIDKANKTITDQQERISDLSAKMDDKTERIRKSQDLLYEEQQKRIADQEEIIALKEEIAELKMHNEWLKLWHCSRDAKDCGRRLPPQKVMVAYVIPDGLTLDIETLKANRE